MAVFTAGFGRLAHRGLFKQRKNGLRRGVSDQVEAWMAGLKA
ncbi:hypothetical protein AB0H07_39515 [Streptomyces sp. NPDC021354]